MSAYIKVCPLCGHHNPEWDDICGGSGCNQFLGMITPVLANSVEKQTDENATDGRQDMPLPQPVNTSASSEKEQPHHETRQEQQKITKRFRPVIYLECPANSKIYEIESGQVIGQAHPTSGAHVQLSDIPNINYVSREHCLFNFDNGQWYVTAIKTATNQTCVNQRLVERGVRMPIRNGDRLAMANVIFQIRIMDL